MSVFWMKHAAQSAIIVPSPNRSANGAESMVTMVSVLLSSDSSPVESEVHGNRILPETQRWERKKWGRRSDSFDFRSTRFVFFVFFFVCVLDVM